MNKVSISEIRIQSKIVVNQRDRLIILREQIKNHLFNRGYNTLKESLFQQKVILLIQDKSSNNKFELQFRKIEVGKVYINILVNELNKESLSNNKSVLWIKSIVEDYFKIAHDKWQYLETLSQEDLQMINKLERKFTPLSIYKRLESNPINQSTEKPVKVYHAGDGNMDTVIYYGDKTIFSDIIQFWISFKTWVSMDNIFEFYDINEKTKLKYIDQSLGLFIPINLEEIEFINVKDLIAEVIDIKKFSSFNCYKMIDEWDNKEILFDFGKEFAIYNWWTTQ